MQEDQSEEALFSHRRGGTVHEGYATTTAKPPISDANVLKLARAFGLSRPHIFAYNHGYRNHSFGILSNGKKYNLMLLKNELDALERVRNADAVAMIVADNLPVRTLANPKTLKVAATTSSSANPADDTTTGSSSFRLARLYHWLPGNTIPWEAYTRKHLRELGKALALLHQSLAKADLSAPKPLFKADLPPLRLPNALDELKSQNIQMQVYFARSGVKNALERKLALKTRQNHQKITTFLTSVPLQSLPCQPLHLDFVRGNILWQDENETALAHGDGPSERRAESSHSAGPIVSGIIDFEKTALGSPLIDLARTYAFLLVDCSKPRSEIERYFLHSGYHKLSHNNYCARERVVFANLTNFFLLFDFYKFLAHNPYESLEKNYHFCRTRDILKERNILEDL
jgi:Ser/Thr protein kinase RdoA (MazF antagonist)